MSHSKPDRETSPQPLADTECSWAAEAHGWCTEHGTRSGWTRHGARTEVLTGPDRSRRRLAQLGQLERHPPQVYVFRLHQLHYLGDEAYVVCGRGTDTARGSGRAEPGEDGRQAPAGRHRLAT